MTPRELTQIVTAIAAVAGIVLWIRFGVRHKRQNYLIVAPLVLLVHTVVYYLAIVVIGLNPKVIIFSNWSAVLRLHEMFTWIILVLQIAEECDRLHGN